MTPLGPPDYRVPVPSDFPSAVVAEDGVTLRLARDSDAELISAWTQAPEVHRFWGGRGLTVEEVLIKYTGRRAPAVISYVVCERTMPVGYVQAWRRPDRCGLDMFLAAEAQGRGIGPRAARALAAELTASGWTGLTVDPALDNPRAIAAWAAAGFVATDEVGVDDGRPTRIMEFALAPAGSTPQ